MMDLGECEGYPIYFYYLHILYNRLVLDPKILFTLYTLFTYSSIRVNK